MSNNVDTARFRLPSTMICYDFCIYRYLQWMTSKLWWLVHIKVYFAEKMAATKININFEKNDLF